MPFDGPRNYYNLRSAANKEIVQEHAVTATTTDTETDMATGITSFRLEKFRGDGTDNVEEYLKKFDRYVKVCNIKEDQQFDLLCLQLEGRAHWYIDSLKPVPKDLAELKAALTTKFKLEKQIKMDIFNMKKLDIESINDFVYRVERDTRDLNLPDQLQVQIAVGGLHPTVQSAISSHGPKNLDDVRTLANRVQQPIAAVSSVNTQHEGPLTQILELLQKLTTEKTETGARPKHNQPRDQEYRKQQPNYSSNRPDYSNKKPCQGCGRSCISRSSCPAWGKSCHNCGKLNHFSPVCRAAKMSQEQNKQQ